MTTPRSIVEDGIAATVLTAALEDRADLDADERALMEVLLFEILGPVPAGVQCPGCDAFSVFGKVEHRNGCKATPVVTWAFTQLPTRVGRQRFAAALTDWAREVMSVEMRNKWLSGELSRAGVKTMNDASVRLLHKLGESLTMVARTKGVA